MEDSQAFFSDKTMTQSKGTLTDKNFLITKEEQVAETLNTFFVEGLLATLDNDEDQISNIIEKYRYRPNRITVKNNFPSHSFVFMEKISKDEILKDLENLDLQIIYDNL